MRTFKFRVWDKEDCVWIDPSHLQINQFGFLYIPYGIAPIKNTRRFVIQQFSGLQDYKDNDLYEGDIVLLDAVEKLEIVFHEGDFMLNGDNLRHLGPINCCCELIGNVFENPELL